MNKQPDPTPSPAPKNAPTAKEAPVAPQTTPPPAKIKQFVAAQTAIITPPQKPPPRWLLMFAMFVRLIWPLAVLGCGVTLFIVIGASGWLWLVLGLIIVCAACARPQQFPPCSP